MTGRPAPPLSIGAPVRNGERFLAEALESLLGQTYGDFELIVSDNGSTDGTEEICRAFAHADGRVRYHRSAVNRGAGWNYNRVLGLARGSLFKWAAHDDLHAPTYLEACVGALEASPAAVLAFPLSRVIDEHSETLWVHRDNLDTRGLAPHDRLRKLVWNPPTMGTSVFGVARTAALRQTRGHGTFLSADYVILAELALLGEFVEVPERLFGKRFHAGMSREAARSDAEAAEWFRPGSARRVHAEYWTLFFQHVVSIARAPLHPAARLRCLAVFAPAWLRVWHECLRIELERLPADVTRRSGTGAHGA